MRSLFTSLAVALFVASSAVAGVTYDFSSVSTGASSGTINGSVKAEGSNLRVDISRGDGVMFENGSWVVSKDGGKTLQVVNPTAKTYYVLNLAELLGGANSLLQSLGGAGVKLDVRNPKVSVNNGGSGGTLEGYPTKKSTITSAYEIAVSGLGRPMSMNVQLTTDVWWTDKLPAEFTNFLQMQGTRTGLDMVDKLIEAERGTIKGFPLKQITTTKMNFGGTDMTSTTTSTVTNVKQVAVAANTFAVPSGFTQTQSPLEKMMSGLGARR
ncbi:MAG TPA: DUF4412 domain-containing protein [Thermoanaerobaculia bacterium]